MESTRTLSTGYPIWGRSVPINTLDACGVIKGVLCPLSLPCGLLRYLQVPSTCCCRCLSVHCHLGRNKELKGLHEEGHRARSEVSQWAHGPWVAKVVLQVVAFLACQLHFLLQVTSSEASGARPVCLSDKWQTDTAGREKHERHLSY